MPYTTALQQKVICYCNVLHFCNALLPTLASNNKNSLKHQCISLQLASKHYKSS